MMSRRPGGGADRASLGVRAQREIAEERRQAMEHAFTSAVAAKTKSAFFMHAIPVAMGRAKKMDTEEMGRPTESGTAQRPRTTSEMIQLAVGILLTDDSETYFDGFYEDVTADGDLDKAYMKNWVYAYRVLLGANIEHVNVRSVAATTTCSYAHFWNAVWVAMCNAVYVVPSVATNDKDSLTCMQQAFKSAAISIAVANTNERYSGVVCRTMDPADGAADPATCGEHPDAYLGGPPIARGADAYAYAVDDGYDDKDGVGGEYRAQNDDRGRAFDGGDRDARDRLRAPYADRDVDFGRAALVGRGADARSTVNNYGGGGGGGGGGAFGRRTGGAPANGGMRVALPPQTGRDGTVKSRR